MMLQNKCCQVGEEISICSLIKIGALKRWVVGSVVLCGEEMGGGWEWQRERRLLTDWEKGWGGIGGGTACAVGGRILLPVWGSEKNRGVAAVHSASQALVGQNRRRRFRLTRARRSEFAEKTKTKVEGMRERREAGGCVSVYVWEENLANTVTLLGLTALQLKWVMCVAHDPKPKCQLH